MSSATDKPFRLLFLCTGNSARSQMAEALLNRMSRGRFHAESAGSQPAARVNPLAIESLKKVGIKWAGHPPHSVDGLERVPWDFVITVCDKAKESCPIFPGQPVLAHWGMEDPADATGTEDEQQRAFDLARLILTRRIELLLALSAEKLDRLSLEGRLRAIGEGS